MKFADIAVILKWRPRPFYNGVHTRDFPILHAYSIMASMYHFATGHLRNARSNMASAHATCYWTLTLATQWLASLSHSSAYRALSLHYVT